jgi:RNA polymerase sigma-70 factor (ECF subfamily)
VKPTPGAGDELRRAAAKVVASLTASLGAESLELVEDAVQDAIVSMLTASAHGTLPADAPSWLYRVAHNRAIDQLRREGRLLPLGGEPVAAAASWAEPHEQDAEVRMLLLCCHPSLTPIQRIALALNVAAGLNAGQVARSLLMTESATRQVLVRGKRRLRERGVDLALEGDSDLADRLDAAIATIYLIFNEGYLTLDGDQLTRPELCRESIRMCGVLLDSPKTANPATHALAALLLFQMARLDSRRNEHGDVVLLADQDRSTWDRRQIAIAFTLLAKAATGDVVTTYHLEAEIASYHARASAATDTDWDAIVRAYDALAAMNPSPIVQLNRAVALAERYGPAAGLQALERIDPNALRDYPFYHTTRGALLERAGCRDESSRAFERALALATSQPVQRFIMARLGLGDVSKNE